MKEFLEKHRDDIVRQWLSKVAGSPASRGLSPEQVIDSLPEYVGSLGRAVGKPGADGAEERARILEAHITTRLIQGFNIDDVVREYLLLGEIVSRALSTLDPSQAPEGAEIDRFYMLLNSGVSNTVTSFGRHLLEDEQNEKRHLRLMDDIATAALGVGTALESRLREVVEIMRDALRAETVMLLLYEASTRRLTMAARASDDLASPCDDLNAVDAALVAGALATRDSFSPTEGAAEVGGATAALAHRLWSRGELIGVVCVGLAAPRRFGVTDRRRLRTLAERLALLIDNARLFQELRNSVTRLEAEQALRERFVSVLAHDLRGPLSAAKLGAQVLLKLIPDPSDKRRELAARIDRNIERTDQMIRDLLDTSLIRAGERLPVRLRECDLGAIARDVVLELGADGHRLVVESDANVRGIWDDEQLKRALWNLVTNALRYGAQDAPVKVSIRRTDSGAEMSVHDEGPALSAEDQARLFEPFHRGHAAQVSDVRGWGLGLTLVRGCATALGGQVRVESEPGKGTTFSMTLPWDSRSVPS